MKVLVVDDNALIRRMLRAILESDGVECREAADSASAFRAVAEQAFDVCLLDLYLPDGDGLDVLRQMAALAASRPMPRVYLLTGSDTEGLAQRALSLGAKGVLFKPFTPEIVLAKVREGC